MFLLILLLLLKVNNVCGSAAEGVETVIVDGQRLIKVTDDEESLSYGFCYAQEGGESTPDVLQKIKQARLDPANVKVYRGREVDYSCRKILETVHLSAMREYMLSSQAGMAFLKQYDMEDAFMCVALEDLGDFCLFLDENYCENQISIGLPPKAHPAQKHCESKYGYNTCFARYKELISQKQSCKDRPIVFCSSGRRGFRGAGEFFYQLCSKGGVLPNDNVNFFFTALSQQGYLNARDNIVNEAMAVARLEGFEPQERKWQEFFAQCVRSVVCQKVHKGRVMFAQDEGNILAPYWTTDVIASLRDEIGPWDVLVGWPSRITNTIMVPYLAQAYKLFDYLSAMDVGCVTGQENVDHMPDRSQHTLICVKGRCFPDDGELFGEMVQERFGYKSVEFVECDLTHIQMRRAWSTEKRGALISGGVVVDEGIEGASNFDVLFHSRRYGRLALENYAEGVCLGGQIYAKVHDLTSRQSGFRLACERGGHAQHILAELAQEKGDLSSQAVYVGLCETEVGQRLDPIKFLSSWYEKTLSENTVDLFIKINKLQDSFVCIGFEDLADFCDVGQFLQGGAVHVSTPKRSKLSKEPRFAACLNHYTKGQPIVFCSSGRNGFATAGEFLFALQERRDICEQKPNLYFCVTALSSQVCKKGGREAIWAAARNAMAFRDGDSDDVFECLSDLSKCIKVVSIGDCYDGKLVFAQDPNNLLVALKPASYEFVGQGTCDVLVDWLPNGRKDAESVAYWRSAYSLFEDMRNYGAGCVTIEAMPDPSKKERTLLCINSEQFDDAEAFGISVANTLGYKKARFASCDNTGFSFGEGLVSTGGVEKPAMPNTLSGWTYS